MAAWPWAQRTADAIGTLLTSRYIHLYCELLDQVGDKVGGRWLVVQIKKRRLLPFQGRRSSPLLESARSCAQAASVSDLPVRCPVRWPRWRFAAFEGLSAVPGGSFDFHTHITPRQPLRLLVALIFSCRLAFPRMRSSATNHL